jgi:hypothetical protein
MSRPGARTGPEVFISYASSDRGRVLAITEQLRSAGVGLWLDRAKIGPGTRWAEEIVRGIRDCKVLMLMCSDAAMRSRAVRQEVQLAWKYELAYLPVLLEPTHFPEQLQFFLEGCQWVEVLDHPPERWLPPVLQALAQAGVGSANAGPADPTSHVRPTQPAPGLEGLRALARFTDRIWPLVVEGRADHPGITCYTVRDLGAARVGASHRIRLGSQLFWVVECDQEAHLLLLDEGPEGKTYCLCPSWFVPETRLGPGPNLLPPPSAGCAPFVLTGVPGREHLLALLTEQPLALDWMPAHPQVPARILSEADVGHLLTLLRGLEPGSWVALATCCDVTV